ncbi:MAG: hypothetical protein RSN61_21265 [Chryseobacterium sp.]|uniref:hypothetical protein n=1 Tax=Chryseobacterium sp. TaxID=1871047 RepID=UPI002FCA4505
MDVVLKKDKSFYKICAVGFVLIFAVVALFPVSNHVDVNQMNLTGVYPVGEMVYPSKI